MKTIKKIVCIVSAVAILLSATSAFAMSTTNFDRGMAKGIDYFNRGMYYEARDEFQWFCDYNWGAMNKGQQDYALGYLDGSKQKISEWESSQKATASYSTSSSSNGGFYTSFNKIADTAKRYGKWDSSSESYQYNVDVPETGSFAFQLYQVSYYPYKNNILCMFATQDYQGNFTGFSIVFDANNAVAELMVDMGYTVSWAFASTPYGRSWEIIKGQEYYYGNLKTTTNEMLNSFMDIISLGLQLEFGVSLDDLGLNIRFR